MRRVVKPRLNLGLLMDSCARDYSQHRTAGQRERLLASVVPVVQAEAAYDAAASQNQLHRFQPSQDVAGPGTATSDDMSGAYDVKMARERSVARTAYDLIKMAAPGGWCPLCGTRSVNQLDHYLPKSEFPPFALLPLNLIPACRDCNTDKLAGFPTRPEEETLHPYYVTDEFLTDPWLHAAVLQTAPPSLNFFVRPPVHWSRLTAARAQRHLDVFKLTKLYATRAGEEVAQIRWRLRKEFERAGAQAVRFYLYEEAASRRAAAMNSWQTATYTALAASDWFCEYGYSAE